MKKSIIIMTTVAALGIGGVLGEATAARAAELEQNKASYSQSDIESKLNISNSKIIQLQEQLYDTQKAYEKLNQSILDVETKITERRLQIAETKKKIENLQKDINVTAERMEARSQLLKGRVRSYQEAGGAVSYLTVLLGSQNFRDFIERAEAVTTIVGADREILGEQQKDKAALEKTQDEMKEELLSVEALLSELQKMKADLTIKQKEQKNAIEDLKEKEEAIQVEIFKLKEMKNNIVKENTAKNNRVNNLANAQNNRQQPASIPEPKRAEVKQSAGNGTFIWPTIGGTITTYQGMRWGSYHKGIDIARPSDYSILAASSGTVTYAGWVNGYGNTIKIKHSNGYQTQYAHLDSIKVKAGQAVSQGSTIGVMGSTGFSTGVHLDFEVYQNGNLLNPIDVLPGR